MQYSVFFFNDTATTEIYTLSLHDALPIFLRIGDRLAAGDLADEDLAVLAEADDGRGEPVALLVLDHLRVARSEEHTSELQSLAYLVCRLLLEKKNRGREYSQHPRTALCRP